MFQLRAFSKYEINENPRAFSKKSIKGHFHSVLKKMNFLHQKECFN
jgi:hypothetical protein